MDGSCSGQEVWQAGGGGANSFVVGLSHLTIHPDPFRDGAPLLLLMETAPTLGRSLRFLHKLHRNIFACVVPFLFRRLGLPSIS